MLRPRKSPPLRASRPRLFWVVAGVLSLAMAAVVFTDSTLTVQADAPLARPAATLPPPAPSANFVTAERRAAKPAIPSESLNGLATWYGRVREDHWTASGERFHEMAMTAAHKTLPFGTLLRVVDLKTHKSVVVRVNDRGQLPEDHVIDLSYAAAEQLDIVKSGVAHVKLEIISLGNDGRRQTAAPAQAAAPVSDPAQ